MPRNSHQPDAWAVPIRMSRILPRLRHAGLAAALWASVSVGAAPRPMDRIVAVVNDEVITSIELERRVNTAEGQLKRQ